MCLTGFVCEFRVYYKRVPRCRSSKAEKNRVFHCHSSQHADAPEIGLRDPARVLNCPQATDNTIGIYAVTDTDKMQNAIKALTLALVAAAAGRAQADAGSALVVSAIFGTEPPSYVHAAVANVLGFTLPTTKIVVHLSTASLAKPDSFTDQGASAGAVVRGGGGGASGAQRFRLLRVRVKCDDEDQEAARRDRGRPEEGTVVQAARARERDRGAPPSGSTRERDALASPAAPAAPYPRRARRANSRRCGRRRGRGGASDFFRTRGASCTAPEGRADRWRVRRGQGKTPWVRTNHNLPSPEKEEPRVAPGEFRAAPQHMTRRPPPTPAPYPRSRRPRTSRRTRRPAAAPSKPNKAFH